MVDKEPAKKVRSRQNVFTRHPDGQKILEKLINGLMGPSEAGRILGCSAANISQYLSKRLKLPSRRQKAESSPSPESEARAALAQLEVLSIQVDGKTPQEITTALSFKLMQQVMLKIVNEASSYEVTELTKAVDVLRRLTEFSIKNRVPEIKDDPLIVDEESMKQLVKSMGDYCEHCRCRKEFLERKAKSQARSRLVAEQSPPLG